MFAGEYAELAEKGRRVAVQALAAWPEKRKLLEDTFGVPYCQMRYPEIYAPKGNKLQWQPLHTR